MNKLQNSYNLNFIMWSHDIAFVLYYAIPYLFIWYIFFKFLSEQLSWTNAIIYFITLINAFYSYLQKLDLVSRMHMV